MDEDTKKICIEKGKSWWNNLTEEEKNKFRENCKEWEKRKIKDKGDPPCQESVDSNVNVEAPQEVDSSSPQDNI